MATTSDILLLTYLSQGESNAGGFANWGEAGNSNFDYLEDAIGEVTSKTLSSSDVTLTAAEERSAIISLSGTISADINVNTNDRKGFWIVKNGTSGNFDVTLKTTSGTGVVCPQGDNILCFSDGTNIYRITDQATPVGTVAYRAASAVPAGWLECNGSAVSRTTYSDLFNIIGTTFGVGNGSTTFNLPDLRGEFIRGFDNGRGVDSGRAFGSSQTDQMEQHSHTFSDTVTSGNNSVNHTHSFSDTATTGNNSVSHTHAGSSLSVSSDSHSHTYQHWYNTNSSDGSGAVHPTTFGNTFTTSSDSHSHSISGSTGTQSANHTHSVTVSGTTGTQSGNHNHSVTVSGTTSNAGGTGNASENRPRNVALLPIIKY